jgi:hypothetical protein
MNWELDAREERDVWSHLPAEAGEVWSSTRLVKSIVRKLAL